MQYSFPHCSIPPFPHHFDLPISGNVNRNMTICDNPILTTLSAV
jgi:hypothetical protein